MVVKVRTMVISVMYKSKLRTEIKILWRVLMMPYEVFLSSPLRSARGISMLESGRGRVGGPVDVL